MTEIDRLSEIREKLEEAHRYVGQDVFTGMIGETLCCLAECDSACADGLRKVLSHAISLRQVDPDAARGAIDYTRGWLAWVIGRLERDAQRSEGGGS